jgi:hypothetical protein
MTPLKDISWIRLNLLILVPCLVGAILFVWLFPGVHIKWYLCAFMTILAFGLVIAINAQRWRKLSFWAIIVMFFAFHVTGYVTLLSRVERWPGLFFVAVFFIEVVAMNVGVAFLLSKASPESIL